MSTSKAIPAFKSSMRRLLLWLIAGAVLVAETTSTTLPLSTTGTDFFSVGNSFECILFGAAAVRAEFGGAESLIMVVREDIDLVSSAGAGARCAEYCAKHSSCESFRFSKSVFDACTQTSVVTVELNNSAATATAVPTTGAGAAASSPSAVTTGSPCPVEGFDGECTTIL